MIPGGLNMGMMGGKGIEAFFSDGENGAIYDPSDLSTLWKDTLRTIQVTTDGDAVAVMDDKSGNGNHLKQETAENRPIYKTSGGLHWLAFDGSDYLETDALSSTLLDGDDGGYFGAACDPNLSDANTYLAEEFNSSTQRVTFRADTRSGGTMVNYRAGGGSGAADYDARLTADTFAYEFNSNGVTGYGYVDGVEQAITSDATGDFASSTIFYLGRTGAIDFSMFIGKFYAAIVVDRGLSTDEKLLSLSYLNDMAGL